MPVTFWKFVDLSLNTYILFSRHATCLVYWPLYAARLQTLALRVHTEIKWILALQFSLGLSEQSCISELVPGSKESGHLP